MKLLPAHWDPSRTLRRTPRPTPPPHPGSGVVGTVRVGRRTRDLTKRLCPGDVAVIDHLDLDRASAEALVARRPAAVVNAAASTSGRFPNLGPQVIVAAGIPLLDAVGPAVMSELADGSAVRLDGGAVLAVTAAGEREVAHGDEMTVESVAAAVQAARSGLSVQLESFAAGTADYLRRERALLLDGVGVPDVRTRIAGRHVLVVVRGNAYREELVSLRAYVREHHPVVIGVDGGADAVLEAGLCLDVALGDMDAVSDRALRAAGEVVVHVPREGPAPGPERVRALGLDPVVFPASATSEDAALLLADDRGASVIVAVGTHATLEEFLDKGRAGMASTFITRLRVGSKLLDAKAASRLHRPRIGDLQLLALLLAGLAALGAAIATTPAGQDALVLAAGALPRALGAAGRWLVAPFGG